MGNVYHIIGPPGTGKTSRLATDAKRAVEARGPDSVLIASLTRAAATEIGGRDTGVNPANVGTLHSIIYRSIGEKRVVLDSPDGIKKWNEHCKDSGLPYEMSGSGIDADDPMADAGKGDAPGDALHERMCDLRHKMLGFEAWPESVLGFARAWMAFGDSIYGIDFTAMIESGLSMPVAPGNPSVLIADEVQDFTPLEAAVMSRWSPAAETSLMAGDEDQSIYSFRGSDARVFIDHPVPDGHRKVLGQSYRVPGEVHALSQKIIRTIPNRLDVEYRPTAIRGEVAFRYDARWKFPETWIGDVLGKLKLCEKGGHPKRGVAILAPCAFQLRPLIAMLRAEGIPFSNEYRRKRGDWNPLGNVRTSENAAPNQLLAFLERGERTWTWRQIKAWLPLLKVRGGPLIIGAKTETERAPIEGVPTDEEFMGLFRSEEAARDALRADPEWLATWASEKDRERLAFPMRVLKRSGPETLRERPVLQVGTIHCSPGDEKVLTVNRGYVAMRDLIPGTDRVCSFNIKCNTLVARLRKSKHSSGYGISVSSRSYEGKMLTLSTSESRTRITPNHSLPVRFSSAFMEKHVVYLMNKGPWWRVGMCVSAHRPYRAGGVGGRLGTEQGDRGWILKVCETRREAAEQEAEIQARFGIPGLTFRASSASRLFSNETLHRIHEATSTEVGDRARAMLRSFGLLEEHPLYTRSSPGGAVAKRNLRGNFQTAACNILSGYMEVGVADPDLGAHRHSRWCRDGCVAEKKKPRWLSVNVTSEDYVGTVYDLSVEKYHHYISGGAIVHNSFKGAEAAHVFLVGALPPRWAENPSAPELARLFYVGSTRASQTLTIIAGDRWGYFS